MTTTVVGKESGTTVVVEDGVKHFPTGNAYNVLFVRGGAESGEAWLQFALDKHIFPFPLPWFRDVITVDKEHPKDMMWNGFNEYLDISFTPPIQK